MIKMKKVLLVIGMLFCVLGNAQRINDAPLGVKTDSVALLSPDGSRLKTKHVPVSTLASWISDAISGGASDDQQLTKVGNTLTLENGGSVDLSEYADQIITNFSFNDTNNVLTLTLDGNSSINVDLSSLSGGGSGGSGGSDTALQIVAKLESLTGDDRLDYSAIKNTPTFTDTNTTNSSLTNVRSGNNVTITLTDSQSNEVSTTFTDLQSSGGGGSGDNNLNEFVATSISDLTDPANANKDACIQAIITMTSDATLASGIRLKNCGGFLDIGTHTLTGQFNSIVFNGYEMIIDAFDGKIEGTWQQPKLYATNLGARDDNQSSTNNFNVAKNIYHLINQSSGHIVWNKQDTGSYWIDTRDDTYGSPFMGNIPNSDDIILVGWGYDGIKTEINGNVTLKEFGDGDQETAMFVVYDSDYTQFFGGGTLEGSRYIKKYNQELEVNTAATSSGNVQLRIIEHPKRADNLTEKEIIINIPLSLSDLATNRQEVTDFINNNNTELADYTAVYPSTGDSGDPNKIMIVGADGTFYTPFFTDVSTGADVDEDVSPYEWGHLIVAGSNSSFGTVKNLTLKNAFGDAIARQVQENGQTSIDFEDLSVGNILDDGTIDSGNTDFYYMTATRNLPTQHDEIQFRHGTVQTVDLAYYRYKIAFYDASDNFLKLSHWLEPQETYHVEDEWIKYRVIVDNSGAADMANFRYFINSPSNARRWNIDNNLFVENRRHHITNPPNGTSITRNRFMLAGGVQPESSVNIEDFGKRSIWYEIAFNEFSDATAIDIVLKGPSKVNIHDNNFKANTVYRQAASSDYDIAISAAYSRNVKVYNNYFDRKSISSDIGHQFYNNDVYNSQHNIRSGGASVYNNNYYNSKIRDGDAGNIVTGSASTPSPSYFENNKIFLNTHWDETPIFDEANTLQKRNTTWVFNHTVSHHSDLSDSSIRLIELNNTGTDFLRADRQTSGGNEDRGFHDGLLVEKIKASPGALHSVGFPVHAAKLRNFDIPTSLEVDSGTPRTFTISEGNIEGWLQFILSQYPTDGVGEFETITVKDVIINIPEQIDSNEGYLNNTQYGGTQRQKIISTPLNSNVNLVFENVKFISKDISNTQFLFFGHRGFTELNNCTFIAPTAETIDFTLTGTDWRAASTYTGANTGPITINNPTTENITFIMRGGDVLDLGSSGTDDQTASEVAVLATPTNYTATNPNVESHLEGIDAALASVGGGSGTVTSVSVTGANGITSTGSPITTSGTIAIDVDAPTLRTTLNVEDGATADQTGSEIVSSIDTELGQTDWKSGGGTFDGGTITNNLVMDNGSNAAPQIRQDILFGGKNYRNAFYLTNGTSNWSNGNLTDGVTRVVSLTSSYFGPSANDVLDNGRLNQKWQDGYFSGTLFATGLDLGGDDSRIVLDGGGTVVNNFLEIPSINLFNVDRTYAIGDRIFRTSSADRVFTVPAEASVNYEVGTVLELINESNTNNPNLVFDPAITVITSLKETTTGNKTYELFATGEKFVFRKIGSDRWELQLITNPSYYTGWADYTDTIYTTGSPFSVVDGAAAVNLPNNAGTTVDSQKPVDVTSFYDGTVITGRNGDAIGVVIEFKVRPTGAGADPRVKVSIDIGGAVGEIYPRDFTLSKGNGVEHFYLSSFFAYTLDTFESNGGTVKVSCENEDIEIYDIRYVITREHKAR